MSGSEGAWVGSRSQGPRRGHLAPGRQKEIRSCAVPSKVRWQLGIRGEEDVVWAGTCIRDSLCGRVAFCTVSSVHLWRVAQF